MFRSGFTLTFFLIFGLSAAAFGQTQDPGSVFTPSEPEEFRPRTVRETMQKMRIDRERKEYQQRLTRGEEAVKLAEEIERSVGISGQLSRSDLSRISDVEKLVRKIRSDLGGKDGDDDDTIDTMAPNDAVAAVKALSETTSKLYDELKKTTRFTISTAAIESSNAVIRVARFLRILK
jgi:hypothetical protein